MNAELPDDAKQRVESWESLSRWERAEVGRELRGLGMSYSEIREWIPVPRSTLSKWVRDVELTIDQQAAIVERTGSRRGVPRDTQWRRRIEVDELRATAHSEVRNMVNNPLWVAGTVMYWAEGSKEGGRDLAVSNSDPRALNLFVSWVRVFHQASAEFSLKLNLHAANDEPAAKEFWRGALKMPDAQFYKTFIKPEGTGHRKNHLAHGVCTVRMRRSADAFVRTMAWIDGLGQELTPKLL